MVFHSVEFYYILFGLFATKKIVIIWAGAKVQEEGWEKQSKCQILIFLPYNRSAPAYSLSCLITMSEEVCEPFKLAVWRDTHGNVQQKHKFRVKDIA